MRTPIFLLGLLAMALTGCGQWHTKRSPEEVRKVASRWTSTPTQTPKWRKADTRPVAAVKKQQPTTANTSTTTTPPRTVVKASEANIQKVIKEAESYLGTGYAWGGMSRSGVDCSGLMVLAFQSVGIALPRVSPDQYKFGQHVGRDKILPGDMLFFWNYKPGVIGHTALCVELVDGIPKFVHASSSGVRHDLLDNAYWSPRFIAACRVWDKAVSAAR